MYLCDLLSTAYSHITSVSLPVLKPRRHLSSIPHCRVLLLLSMIPLIRCQTDSIISSSTKRLDTTVTRTNSYPTTTTAISQNSCPSDDLCQVVFSNYYDRLNITNLTAHKDRQCNYTYFESLLDKYDCDPPEEKERQFFLRTYSRNVTCDICLEYYQQWLCATENYYQGDNGSWYPPCESLLCHRVRRACPYIHPDDDDESYSSEPSFICNDIGDEKPCYYFNTNFSKDRFPDTFTYSCDETSSSNGSICILISSSQSIHFSSNIAIYSLLIILYQICS